MVLKRSIFFSVLMVAFCLGINQVVFAQEIKSIDTTFQKLDIIPQFPGGNRGWQRFLERNMDIMEAAEAMDSTAYVNYGMRQTAQLEFTVCEDGEVCDIVIINRDKISPEFAKEALRVMKNSPKWQPAKVGERSVRTRMKQSITAILEL